MGLVSTSSTVVHMSAELGSAERLNFLWVQRIGPNWVISQADQYQERRHDANLALGRDPSTTCLLPPLPVDSYIEISKGTWPLSMWTREKPQGSPFKRFIMSLLTPHLLSVTENSLVASRFNVCHAPHVGDSPRF